MYWCLLVVPLQIFFWPTGAGCGRALLWLCFPSKTQHGVRVAVVAVSTKDRCSSKHFAMLCISADTRPQQTLLCSVVIGS